MMDSCHDVLCHIDGFRSYIPNPRLPHFSFTSLGGLIDLAIRFKERELEDGCTFFFRGENACFEKPLASLFVPGVDSTCEKLFYQAALSSAPNYFYSLKTTLDRLSQMRHYDFPTRILDISENILTAWFMALDAWHTVHGLVCQHPEIQENSQPFPCPRIIVFRVPNIRIRDAESDTVTNIASLAKLSDNCSITELWHEIKQERLDFQEDVFWNCLGDLFTNWCVRPRMTNPRVTDQEGAYILYGLSPETVIFQTLQRTHNSHWKFKKSDASFAPIFPTCCGSVENPQISQEGFFMPAQSVLEKFTNTKRTAIVDYVDYALRELELVGIAPHTIYRDDFNKHAKHWRKVVNRRKEKHSRV